MIEISDAYELTVDDCLYSNSLKKIGNPPKKIWCIGNSKLLNENSVAVVGSRNCSEYGENITKKIVKELVERSIVVVSGLANGIDSVAHKSCIEFGGKTIAVLGSGFKHIYPKENEKLFYDIISNKGLVISEYPIYTEVNKKNFPKRNRIISGLVCGVLVIEAAYRSGTSITARLAKNQEKPVYCIPNCIGNKNSYGTIELLKNGAIPISNGKEMIDDLVQKKYIDKKNYTEDNVHNKQLKILDLESQKIVECIKEQRGLDANMISYRTGLEISKVNQLVTLLEIDDVIVDNNGYELREAYYE